MSEPPIYAISLQKVTDTGVIDKHPIYTGYAVKGLSAVLPEAGAPFTLLRTERNGEHVLGIFRTSPVQSCVVDDARGTFRMFTANSIYEGTFVLDERTSIELDCPVDNSP